MNKTQRSLLRKMLEKRRRKNPPTHCSYRVVSDDIFSWQGAIMGPLDTPFEGVFFLSINFPNNYPFNPPKIIFKTKVLSLFIYILIISIYFCGYFWKRMESYLTIDKLLLSIRSFLPDPNADDPINPISNMYSNERKAYNEKARQWTINYAMN
ncbi:hypothetical protein UlMin_010323 [Ulmus minor]